MSARLKQGPLVGPSPWDRPQLVVTDRFWIEIHFPRPGGWHHLLQQVDMNRNAQCMAIQREVLDFLLPHRGGEAELAYARGEGWQKRKER